MGDAMVAQPLADCMVMCGCLPCTMIMLMVLTKSAGGDEAAAVFHCVFGNILGAFLVSPLLIPTYLDISSHVDLVVAFTQLALRVVLPVVSGQLLQASSTQIVLFVQKFKVQETLQKGVRVCFSLHHLHRICQDLFWNQPRNNCQSV